MNEFHEEIKFYCDSSALFMLLSFHHDVTHSY